MGARSPVLPSGTGWDGMTGFLKDLRYAGRSLRRAPGLSAIAVTALALGIGLTATMFSIVYAALMRGLPYEDGDRIVVLNRVQTESGDRMGVPSQDYAAWREQQASFNDLAAWVSGTMNVRWTDRAERFSGGFFTANAFETLGVGPVLGRTFGPEEDRAGAPLTVVLSWQLWQDRFDGSREALGRTVQVNGEPAEIIGVMPEGFHFPSNEDLWVPLREDPLATPWGEGRYVSVFGTLRPDVSADQAMVQMNAVASRLEEEHPETNEGLRVEVRPFTETAVGDEARPLLLTMLGAVGLVLLIACANVANLLLARASTRTREMAVRTAMGAHRWRVMSQMVAEAAALALVGAVLGTGLAWVGVELFARAVEGTDPPFWLVFELDGAILLFILALAVVSALISGAIPAWNATAGSVSEALKDESRGSSSLRIGRLSRWLVVGELALSVGLLVAAGLMVKSITTLSRYEYAFDTEEVFTARLGLFETDYPEEADRLRFFEDVLVQMRSAPGVTAAAVGNALPGGGSGSQAVAVEGRAYPDDLSYPVTRQAAVSPGYFRVFGVEPLLGRTFEQGDDADALPVAVVNESFARTHFPDGSPMGARIRAGRADSQEEWRTVVGVVPDLFMQGVGNPTSGPEGYYVPMAQSDNRFMSLAARGPSQVMTLSGPIREAVAAVDDDIPLYWVNTLQERIDQNTWIYNVFGTLFLVFGVAALFLASVGLYGVMSFSVSRRTSEVGIRMALGAEGGQVLGLILRQGLGQIGMGLVLGLGLAVLLSRGVQLILFQVSPNDPVVFGGIVLLLAATGLLASLVPARRATRVDPLVALRAE